MNWITSSKNRVLTNGMERQKAFFRNHNVIGKQKAVINPCGTHNNWGSKIRQAQLSNQESDDVRMIQVAMDIKKELKDRDWELALRNYATNGKFQDKTAMNSKHIPILIKAAILHLTSLESSIESQKISIMALKQMIIDPTISSSLKVQLYDQLKIVINQISLPEIGRDVEDMLSSFHISMANEARTSAERIANSSLRAFSHNKLWRHKVQDAKSLNKRLRFESPLSAKKLNLEQSGKIADSKYDHNTSQRHSTRFASRKVSVAKKAKKLTVGKSLDISRFVRTKKPKPHHEKPTLRCNYTKTMFSNKDSLFEQKHLSRYTKKILNHCSPPLGRIPPAPIGIEDQEDLNSTIVYLYTLNQCYSMPAMQD